MKKIISAILILTFAAISFSSCAGRGSESPIIGRWKANVPLDRILAVSDDGAANEYEDLGIDLREYSLDITFDFKESGKVDVGIDGKSADETLKALFGEYIEKAAEADAKTADEYAAEAGYKDKEAAVKAMLSRADFSVFGATYSYSADDKFVDIAGCRIEYSPGDSPVFVSADVSAAEDDSPKYLEKILPVTLKK